MKNNHIPELTICMAIIGLVTLIYQAALGSGVTNLKQADLTPSEWIYVSETINHGHTWE